MSRSFRASGALAFVLVVLASSCAKAPPESTVLQASDLTAASGAFSPDEIVPVASFTDDATLAEAAIQRFLEQTPYGGPSFLSSYSSNGTRADDAIMAAAAEYGLNPIVLLVRAEMNGGLIGLEVYPSDPSRVEYVFGCGCADSGSDCDPALAGFDVQVDCLASALRESLDAIAAAGHTDGGWGPGIAMTTLDGVRVTPADASTAALYQYTPAVDQGAAGGNWLFWNLWQKYASALGYKGATTAQAIAPLHDGVDAEESRVPTAPFLHASRTSFPSSTRAPR